MPGKRSAVFIGLVLSAILLFASVAAAETRTLFWNGPTAYTDNTPIGTAPITYTAFWSASPTLTSPHSLMAGGSATSAPFDPDAEGMVRGSTVYFAVYATVNGVNSANATTSWLDQYKTPNPPGNPRIVLIIVPWTVPGRT